MVGIKYIAGLVVDGKDTEATKAIEERYGKNFTDFDSIRSEVFKDYFELYPVDVTKSLKLKLGLMQPDSLRYWYSAEESLEYIVDVIDEMDEDSEEYLEYESEYGTIYSLAYYALESKNEQVMCSALDMMYMFASNFVED